MGINMLPKAAGKYCDVIDAFVKVNGTWRTINSTYVKVNGEWRSELQLATPTITWNSDTDILTISPVDNAIEYEITIEWEYYIHTFYTSNTSLHISEFYQELFSVPSNGLDTLDSYYIKVRAVRDGIFSDYSDAVWSSFGEWFNVSHWFDYSGMCSEDNCVSQFETLRAYLDSDSDYIQDHNAVVLLNGIPFVAVYNDTQGIEFYNDHFGMTYYIHPDSDYDQNNEYVYGLVIYDITDGACDKVNDFMIDWYEPTQESSDTITVTYDGNGGTIDGQSTKTISVNSGTTITLPTPIRSGYVFSYWEDNINNSPHDAGDTYTVTQSITFTAQWTYGDDNDSCPPHSWYTYSSTSGSDCQSYGTTTKKCSKCGATTTSTNTSIGPHEPESVDYYVINDAYSHKVVNSECALCGKILDYSTESCSFSTKYGYDSSAPGASHYYYCKCICGNTDDVQHSEACTNTVNSSGRAICRYCKKDNT